MNKIMVKVCKTVTKALVSVANVATNTVSVFAQYEHEMPKCLKK